MYIHSENDMGEARFLRYGKTNNIKMRMVDEDGDYIMICTEDIPQSLPPYHIAVATDHQLSERITNPHRYLSFNLKEDNIIEGDFVRAIDFNSHYVYIYKLTKEAIHELHKQENTPPEEAYLSVEDIFDRLSFQDGEVKIDISDIKNMKPITIENNYGTQTIVFQAQPPKRDKEASKGKHYWYNVHMKTYTLFLHSIIRVSATTKNDVRALLRLNGITDEYIESIERENPDDNTCKWEILADALNRHIANYRTSCSDELITMSRRKEVHKYCCICGKPIKETL